jgi:hypothetical protein
VQRLGLAKLAQVRLSRPAGLLLEAGAHKRSPASARLRAAANALDSAPASS